MLAKLLGRDIHTRRNSAFDSALATRQITVDMEKSKRRKKKYSGVYETLKGKKV